MPWQVVGRNHRKDGNVGQIFASTRWLRLFGLAWRFAIDAGLLVTQPARNAWRISFPDPAYPGWIELHLNPADEPVFHAAKVSDQLGRRFGAIVRALDIPSTLRWTVTYSAGVRKTANGNYILATIDGRHYGLDLSDWADKIASRDGDNITMDLTAHKAAVSLDVAATINLDPSSVDIDAGDFGKLLNTGAVFLTVRGDASTSAAGGIVESPVAAGVGNFGTFTIERQSLQFDDTVPEIDSATFFCTRKAGETVNNLHLSVGTGLIEPLNANGPPGSRANYGKGFAAYTTNPLGTLVNDAGEGSKAITPALWADPLYLFLVHVDDIIPLAPGPFSGVSVEIQPPGHADEPFILYVAVVAGGGMIGDFLLN